MINFYEEEIDIPIQMLPFGYYDVGIQCRGVDPDDSERAEFEIEIEHNKDAENSAKLNLSAMHSLEFEENTQPFEDCDQIFKILNY